MLTASSNRRLDNRFNIFEGLSQNWFFIGINTIMCGAQVLIVFYGGDAFNITHAEGDPPQTAAQWGYALVLGIISIPVGAIIRLIPDGLIERLIPSSFKRRSGLPGLTVTDEERFNHYPAALADVREELAFLKRIKGGRLNNLTFAMQHPREMLNRSRSKSPSHSRSNSVKLPPQTPVREDSMKSTAPAPTPDSRRRSRSMRSRSNSALGAPTVMAGIIAGSVAVGWSPVDRAGGSDNRDFGASGPRASPLSNQGNGGGQPVPVYTEEPENMEQENAAAPGAPDPAGEKSRKSVS